MSKIKMVTYRSRKGWLEHRTGIGGSDAAAILGLNPYCNNVELWEKLTGRREAEDISKKPYVLYGTKAEKHLRELFKLDFPEYKVEYKPNNVWINEDYPFAHASLDGWLIDQEGRKGVWECKTTNILQSMQKERWNERIPDNYYVQCLWYLAITEFDFCILKAQLKSEFKDEIYLQTKHYKFERSEVQEDIKYLLDEARKFWEYVERDQRPPLKLPDI